MDDHSFAENGIEVSELDDYQTEEFTKSKDLQVCLVSLLGMAGSLACFIFLSQSPRFEAATSLYEALLIATFCCFLFCGLVGFRIEAASDGKLPSPEHPVPPPDHITGLVSSWRFVIGQSVLFGDWLVVNAIGRAFPCDRTR